jgi:rhodanese-related sulfurtransferase
MRSPISQLPAASAENAVAHFKTRFAFETDCWDTHDSLVSGDTSFVLLDVRGPGLYRRSHIPGAINLPHGKIIESKMAQWPNNTLFVVYCAGPHCNGSSKGALRLAELGRPVKELIGGMTGWADEGFAFFSGAEPGHVTDVE